MPKTRTKKKVTGAYYLNLGNIEERGGHRRDCAQISAKIVCRKDAVGEEYKGTDDDTEAFLVMLKDSVHDQTFEFELWEGFVVEVVFNTERCVKKDVEVLGE